MAKTTVLLLLLVLVAADRAAAAAPKQLSKDAQEAIDAIHSEIANITSAVVSATPPAKRQETMKAVTKHLQVFGSALDKAKESGDQKQLLYLFMTVKLTTAAITKAATPEMKLKYMEDGLNSVAAPDKEKCPNVDKAYCEMQSKLVKATEGVLASLPPEDKKVRASIGEKIMLPLRTTVNQAYVDGDRKKIDQVLAAYTKAADEVIAAAPAEKLKVMEKTFTAAAAAGN